MDRYLVTHEYTCKECNGEGFYYEPMWIEANAAWDAVADAIPNDVPNSNVLKADAGSKALKEFWAERGYYSERSWPSEQPACGECEGEGIIREKVDLMDALAWLQKQAQAQTDLG